MKNTSDKVLEKLQKCFVLTTVIDLTSPSYRSGKQEIDREIYVFYTPQGEQNVMMYMDDVIKVSDIRNKVQNSILQEIIKISIGYRLRLERTML